MTTETTIAEQDLPRHRAVSDSKCACGWQVDGFTAPELVAWKLNGHISHFKWAVPGDAEAVSS